jgi:hypothetical protein
MTEPTPSPLNNVITTRQPRVRCISGCHGMAPSGRVAWRNSSRTSRGRYLPEPKSARWMTYRVPIEPP